MKRLKVDMAERFSLRARSLWRFSAPLSDVLTSREASGHKKEPRGAGALDLND